MEGSDFIAKVEQLRIPEGWSKREAARYHTEAIDDDIISNYGVDLTNLEEWRKLCRDVDIEPVPRSITQCKKALKHVLVNLVDLVNYRHLDIPVRQFSSMREFPALCCTEFRKPDPETIGSRAPMHDSAPSHELPLWVLRPNGEAAAPPRIMTRHKASISPSRS
ncbi:hypothetical protein K458DRAFT_388885 [Lentithecium fluviatile CBS 122367]|uniref:Uncharacterized protein n=1 Tax=Lentithecium fluviatile CBS 122367 TaxID=1168545 RepID=A0A6G1J2F6_9PLEO|nr:hypothetical protein K458DRAFT_388885 [Lentithecium fluviatile CBS 122367]